jgi:predicted nucleotidyltransferase component of viral defense system
MLWKEIISNSKVKNLEIHQNFQEEMQKAILAYLSREVVFNDIVFQGGTSLRFFYGNPRFSEDLDFVLKQGKYRFDLIQKVTKIKKFISNVFPFLEVIKIEVQKNNKKMQRLIFKTMSDLQDQKLRIHLELAYIPSYHNQPKILKYPPLNPAIRVEEPYEILADKITALGLRSYLKGRDIWDIYFLTVEKQISIPWNLVFKKSKDYNSTPTKIKEKLLNSSEKIRKEGNLILSNEMKRFLPKTLLDQYDEIFTKIVDYVAEITENVKMVKKSES